MRYYIRWVLCLKHYDYINSIFDENATIAIGNVRWNPGGATINLASIGKELAEDCIKELHQSCTKELSERQRDILELIRFSVDVTLPEFTLKLSVGIRTIFFVTHLIQQFNVDEVMTKYNMYIRAEYFESIVDRIVRNIVWED